MFIRAYGNANRSRNTFAQSNSFDLFRALTHCAQLYYRLFFSLEPQKTTGGHFPPYSVRLSNKDKLAWLKAVSRGNQADLDEYNKSSLSRLRKSEGLGIVLNENGDALLVSVFAKSFHEGDDTIVLHSGPSFPLMSDSL
ncbi:hypothetical protein COOONC_01048 [Cooperia oncophora]